MIAAALVAGIAQGTLKLAIIAPSAGLARLRLSECKDFVHPRDVVARPPLEFSPHLVVGICPGKCLDTSVKRESNMAARFTGPRMYSDADGGTPRRRRPVDATYNTFFRVLQG
jgi:hypothetical protein